MNDSRWLAELHRYGLIRPSLIPSGVFQKLRMLTRHRKGLVEDSARVKNRTQKILEDGNVKLGCIVSDVFGKSGLAVLELIASGVKDAAGLAAGMTTNIRRKKEAYKALRNYLTDKHVFLIRKLLSQYRQLREDVAEVDKEIARLATPYRHLLDKLKKIPGIEEVLAVGILAESTDDMGNFKNDRHYAARAGVAAANGLARAVYKVLGGENYKDLGYTRGGQADEKRIGKLILNLKLLGLNVRLKEREVVVTRESRVTTAGEVLA